VSAADREITRNLERWFAEHQRDFAWRRIDARTGRRDAWRSFVSEIMLQQTQASRVVERFDSFIERFPTAGAMADAGEDAVVSAWSGMGYYRRARNLYRAAVEIVERFGGSVPECVEDLRSLPGAGAYTAGAIASVVFGAREAIVDANVTRVLLRLEGRELGASSKEARALSWSRAGELVASAGQPGVFNEAIMELGALVCLPRGTRCEACPIRGRCAAFEKGLVESIPALEHKIRGAEVVHASVVLCDRSGRVYMERRGSSGLWAGMWQPVTVERERVPRGVGTVIRELELGICGAGARRGGVFKHGTSSRDVRFVSWVVREVDARVVRSGGHRRWVGAGEMDDLALGSPQRRVLVEAGVFD
jgi:A/G-specific adenine glycosylase